MPANRLLHPSTRLERRRRAALQARGFTLIEILVAIVVLSFGMLGLVGVQAFSMQANRESRLQSTAASLSRELADMMRGNNVVAVKTAKADNPYLYDSSSTLTSNTCLGVANSSSGCATAQNVAQSEMTDWINRVNAALPGAVVVVCFDPAPYDSGGLPRWTCPEVTSADTNRIAVIKMGWTRRVLDRSQTGAGAFNYANAGECATNDCRPIIVTPVTGGNPISAPTGTP